MAWSQLAQRYKCFVCGSNSIQGFSNDKVLITLKKRKEMVWLLKQIAQRHDVLLLFVGVNGGATWWPGGPGSPKIFEKNKYF